jgi:L-seryl-tRNA(Ser) seleniumtransferase
MSEEFRNLPQVDRLIDALGPASGAGAGGEPHALKAAAARRVIAEARAAIGGGAPAPTMEQLAASASRLLAAGRRRRVVPVVNATGVLLHTNLGRAPMGRRQLDAVAAVAAGYSNLEFDLAEGRRGSRYDHARELLTALTGAEAALVVNNNAAAVLLVLACVARGREVVISRGELIEIGGEFRIPAILEESGATLREVGTTNRTHLRDYREAIGESTAAVMKVHPSNYQVVGFTASVPGRELAELAHAASGGGIPLIHDIGSGLLRHSIAGRQLPWLAEEPTVEASLADGADVVTFSGDKLLGGPQAGLIAGRAEIIAAMEHSPLLRTYRVDKTTLAALETTLLTYLEGREDELPLWSMGLLAPSEIEARAAAVRSALLQSLLQRGGDVDAKVELVDGFSTTGGGSAPTSRIPTVLLEVAPRSWAVAAVRKALIDGDPPVVARVEEDRLVLDLRTVAPDQDATVAEALCRALSSDSAG